MHINVIHTYTYMHTLHMNNHISTYTQLNKGTYFDHSIKIIWLWRNSAMILSPASLYATLRTQNNKYKSFYVFSRICMLHLGILLVYSHTIHAYIKHIWCRKEYFCRSINVCILFLSSPYGVLFVVHSWKCWHIRKKIKIEESILHFWNPKS